MIADCINNTPIDYDTGCTSLLVCPLVIDTPTLSLPALEEPPKTRAVGIQTLSDKSNFDDAAHECYWMKVAQDLQERYDVLRGEVRNLSMRLAEMISEPLGEI